MNIESIVEGLVSAFGNPAKVIGYERKELRDELRSALARVRKDTILECKKAVKGVFIKHKKNYGNGADFYEVEDALAQLGELTKEP